MDAQELIDEIEKENVKEDEEVSELSCNTYAWEYKADCGEAIVARLFLKFRKKSYGVEKVFCFFAFV